MSVPILDASAWREFRGIPSGQGLNKTTHLAKLLTLKASFMTAL